jgi:hypothetical protein
MRPLRPVRQVSEHEWSPETLLLFSSALGPNSGAAGQYKILNTDVVAYRGI